MKNGTYSNTIQIIGLNSELYNVPKRKFILYFGDNEKTDSGNEDFVFEKELRSKGDAGVVIDINFKVLKKEIGTENYIDRCQELNRILNDLPLQIYYTDIIKKQ